MTAEARDMTFEEYAALKHCNFSTLKEVRTSAHAAKHKMEAPREDADHFRKGRGLHTRVLEPDRFESLYAVWSNETSDYMADSLDLKRQKAGKEGAPTRSGKVWEAFQEAAATRTILTAAQVADIEAVAQAVAAHPGTTGLIDDLQHVERTITWTNGHGMECKGRLDAITQGYDIVDLKGCKDPSPRSFANACHRYGYFMQAAMYVEGLWAAMGKPEKTPDYYIIAAQNIAPYDVVPYKLTMDALIVGETDYNRCCDVWVECIKTGKWPGLSDDVVDLHPPAWAISETDNFFQEEVAS